ncbi:hypothetical protein KSF_091490 [Reticulibacter mediterranei]|uniref:Mersacidin/lichenicidin family type 2 lantibiotic n=1 Tax=Reticulibacter mediterranei TaxID=2778369 RepID=A0A8J3IQW4_9CHLR|nr:mersacidin/lichenicidin family type 2 lantibiotic [Reticulibacter mediterranei]GHO99101.1 hypothetical protein KSF_091490 [Reticulibacter mediterranei]
MSADEIIRVWKAEDDEEKGKDAPANPAGEELSDEDLEQVEGGTEPGNGNPTSPYCASYQTLCPE